MADSACGRPSSCTRKSVQKPDLPSSPSNSGSVHREAQQQYGGGIKKSPKTPIQKHDSSSADQGSGTKGQKRKRGSAERQVQKRCKTTELDNSAVTCTGSQSSAQEPDNQERDNQEPDTHLDPIPDGNKPETTKANSLNADPIQYWAHNQRWPENFAKMTQVPSALLEKKASDISYTQRYKNGEVPQAYSPEHQQHLLLHGVNMPELAGHSHVSEDSKKLCEELLRGTHEEPQNTIFSISRFSSVKERIRIRNKARVFRDLTPLLVPSPELLFESGENDLKDLVEEIGAEWTKCKTQAGPMPKPDFAVGLAWSAFSKEEMAKLRNYTTPDQPTAFTDNLYFPFVLCEVKCSDQGMNSIDRKNMHSASIAVNAITMLNKTLGPNNMDALDGEILVYSISYDHEQVRIYGHLTYQEVFYRSPIAAFLLDPVDNYAWKKTHDFFREVYRLVYPTHLQRIKKALKAMANPRTMSDPHTMSTSSVVASEAKESGLQQQDASTSSSQEDVVFKKPGMPASRKQKSEVALLQEQLAEQQKQLVEQQKQLAEQQKQLVEQEEQLAEQQRQAGEELGQAAEGIMKAAELMSQAGKQYDQMTK